MQGCYFLGKALWDKGHSRLMDLLAAHNSKQGARVRGTGVGSLPPSPAYIVCWRPCCMHMRRQQGPARPALHVCRDCHERPHALPALQVFVDVFGAGPDLGAIQAEAARRGLPLTFQGQADHCSPALREYKARCV